MNKFTKQPGNHTKFYIFEIISYFPKWQNSDSGSDKTKIFMDKVPITLQPLVALMHNSTTIKE